VWRFGCHSGAFTGFGKRCLLLSGNTVVGVSVGVAWFSGSRVLTRNWG
jgi:hypothetical protein